MIMARLKTETLAQHRALEAQMPLLDPELQLETYGQLLQAWYGVVASLETHLASLSLPDTLDLQGRAKTPLLERDLAALGLEGSGLERPSSGLSWPLDHISALGALYVLEGATLGGQIIVRHLQHLGLCAEHGAAYFAAYGPQTGARWKEFGNTMNQLVQPEQEQAVIFGAQHTFGAFDLAVRALNLNVTRVPA